MSDDSMLEIIAEQERTLRFASVSVDDLVSIGNEISQAIGGASANNRCWAVRKANIAELNQKSSMRVAIENRKKGRGLADMGLSGSEYALEGGAFPVLLPSGIGIGSIAVSGMPSAEDHQTVCSVIASHLGCAVPSII